MRIAAMLVCASIGCSAYAQNSTVAQWPAASRGNDHYYAAVRWPDGESASWPRSRDRAVQMQGHLATVTSQDEAEFILRLCDSDVFWSLDDPGNAFGPWLGGTQPAGSVEPDGGWRWITDEPWAYTNWLQGEPNNLIGNENSLHMFAAAGSPRGAFWNDERQGRAVVRSFVAEFECLYALELPGDRLICRGSQASFRFVGGGPNSSFRWQIQPTGEPWRDLSEGRTPAECGSIHATGVLTPDMMIAIEECGSNSPYSFRLRCVLETSCGTYTTPPATATHCPADLTCDSFVDFFDYARFVVLFETGEIAADFNADGFIDFFDYAEYVGAFEVGC